MLQDIFRNLPHLGLWPMVAYPLGMSVILYTLYFYNRIIPLKEVAHPSVYPILRGFYGVAIGVDLISVVLSVRVFGWYYLPILIALLYIFYFRGKTIFGFVPFFQYIGPAAYILLVYLYAGVLGLV
jgi:hypothetical protein